jgi:hypothetical protein
MIQKPLESSPARLGNAYGLLKKLQMPGRREEEKASRP